MMVTFLLLLFTDLFLFTDDGISYDGYFFITIIYRFVL